GDPMPHPLTHPYDLDGRVAIVTGSTSGIGKAVAQLLARLGARVVVNGRNSERGDAVVEGIVAEGGQARFVEADLLDADSCRRLVAAATEAFGRLDVLVNNAADTARGDVRSTGIDDWDRIHAINLRAPFILLQAAVEVFDRQGGG